MIKLGLGIDEDEETTTTTEEPVEEEMKPLDGDTEEASHMEEVD